MRKRILQFIDFFYPPFKRFIPLQTFRYAATGGANMLLDIFLFYISFHFILRKEMLDLGFITLKSYNAALMMAFCITFPTGFLLSKYIVFHGSYLRSRIQLFRYCVIVAINLFLNYILLNFFVQLLHIYPTVSRIITTVLIVIFSYLAQKNFTFRMKPMN